MKIPNLNTTPYSSSVGSDGKHCVNGPGDGFGYHAGTLWPDRRFSSQADSHAAASLCNEAYLEGMKKTQEVMRDVLGVKS